MTKIITKEVQEKKKNIFDRIADNIVKRVEYPVKKMEVLMGRYKVDDYVVLSQRALMKSMIYSAVVMRENKGKEVMGILVGYRKPGRIVIWDAWIGDCLSEHAETEIDPVALVKIIEKAKKRNLSVLGWFHSHPHFSSSPSGVDTATNHQWEKLIKDPIMLILTLKEFYVGTTIKGWSKKLDFVIPPTKSNKIDLELDFLAVEDDQLINKPELAEYWKNVGYWQPGIVPGIPGPLLLPFFAYVGKRTRSMPKLIKGMFSSKTTTGIKIIKPKPVKATEVKAIEKGGYNGVKQRG